MRTKEEILELIKSDKINESKLSNDELELITGDDFESFSDVLRFTHQYKEFFIARADYCEKNMVKDLAL